MRKPVTVSGRIERNATIVLRITIGLTTGAASMYARATLSGVPLRISRRITGITPHSHIGSASPASAPLSVARKRFFGSIRASTSDGRKTSMIPLTSEPSSTNGSASKRMLNSTREKSPNSAKPRVSWNEAGFGRRDLRPHHEPL